MTFCLSSAIVMFSVFVTAFTGYVAFLTLIMVKYVGHGGWSEA